MPLFLKAPLWYFFRTTPRADWAVWQPDTCQVGRLVSRLVGRHVKCWSRSNDLPRKQGLRSDGGERMELWTKSQRGGEGRREWNRGGAMAPLAEEGWLYLDILVPSYATADGACLPT